MKIFVNANQRVTAIDGQCVYELTMSLGHAFAVVETWLRGGDHVEMGATDQQRAAATAVKALILANCTVGHKSELEAHDDPRLRLFNQNVHPSGRAGSSQWAIGR